MNRAARRAAGNLQVTIGTDIAVVPMEHTESYYTHEIAREGQWRDGVQVIVLRPTADVGRAAGDWFPRLFTQMQDVRQRFGTIPLRMNGQAAIDVGMIDVTVFFHVPEAKALRLLRSKNRDELFERNLATFDTLCDGALHDQMIVATAAHICRADGSYLVHFHNLIFGLRKEVHEDRENIGLLDLEPLLRVLGTGRHIAIVTGMRQ